jgi:mono/diheme cytochrome c family protein
MTHTSAIIFSAAFWGVLATGTTCASANTVGNYANGELLYQTHCIDCHTTQMHWRDNRIAKDWPGLRFQVNRWQKQTGLLWSEQEVADVAHYLNVVHYQFSTPNVATLRRNATR